jgi:hypothetical protein
MNLNEPTDRHMHGSKDFQDGSTAGQMGNSQTPSEQPREGYLPGYGHVNFKVEEGKDKTVLPEWIVRSRGCINVV